MSSLFNPHSVHLLQILPRHVGGVPAKAWMMPPKGRPPLQAQPVDALNMPIDWQKLLNITRSRESATRPRRWWPTWRDDDAVKDGTVCWWVKKKIKMMMTFAKRRSIETHLGAISPTYWTLLELCDRFVFRT